MSNKKETVEWYGTYITITGKVDHADTGETEVHTCKIPKPKTKPSLIKCEVIDICKDNK